MSAVLNDRDAILQAAATRIVNPKNADILLQQSALGFHVNAAGAADVESITVSGTLVGLEGALSWTIQGATATNVTDREVTINRSSMQGTTAIVTASIMSSGERFARSVVLATTQDGAPGSSAKTVKLTPSEQVFKINKAGAGSPASITLTASGQNTAGTPSFTIPVGTATLTAGSSSAQKVLTLANMTTDQVTIEVTLDGQKDRVTIYKVREGQDGQPGVDAVVGLLTNETVTLPAGSNGVVSSFSGAVCTMKMYQGVTDDSANWAYAFSPASASNRLSYTTSGGTLTVTGMAAGVDSAYVDITASRTGYASVTKRFTVTKSKAGASVTGARGAGTYYVVGSAWSDVAAQAACPGGPVVNDQVTISNGTVTYTKRWDGAAWNVPGAYLSGSLFVEGDINGSKLKAGTVQITTPDGTPVVTIGGLQPGFEAPGTKNSEQQWIDVQGIPYATILNNDDSVAMGFNPTFAAWSGARPDGWGGSVANAAIKETSLKISGPWALRFNTDGANNSSINKRITLPTSLPAGTFLSGVYNVYIESINAANTTGKPGIMVRLWWGTAAGEYSDSYFPAELIAGAWQRVSFTARQTAGRQILQVEFYVWGSYSNVQYMGGRFYGNVIFDSFRFALFDNTVDNKSISIGSDGTLGGAGGGQVTITGLGYTGALDATKGAPAGTTVGGTLAETVASNAAAGKSASDAIPGINTSLAGKLAAAGNQNLTGPVTLTSSGAIVVGTVNDGVRINTTGIIGRKAGYTTFSVAADGTALFGGTMTAVTGTFGKVELLSTGEVSGGNFVTKNPASEWPAAGTGPGFQIGNGALRLGNFNDGKYVFIGYDGNIIAPGLQLINGQLTLTSTVIVSPRVSQPIYDTFAYNALGGGFVSGPNGSLSNSVTLQITGNNGPHKIAWSYVRLAGGTPSAPSWADGSGDTFGVGATATNTTLSFKVSAVITGTDGRTLNYSDIFTLQFGTI